MPGNDFASALLQPTAPLPAAVYGHTPRRFAVYRNNVTVGLMRSIEANFPVVRQLLGEIYFAGLAREYVQAQPPHSPLLFQYGEGFAAFLAGQEDLQRYPYLADVARLEQLCRIAYHAADAPVLHATAFSGVSENEMTEMRFASHPAFALHASAYAVHSIFNASRDGDGTTVDIGTPEQVLVTRPFFEVQIHAVTPGQHAFFAALAAASTLSAAAEQGYDSESNFDLADSVRLMLETGAFQPLNH